MKFATKYRVIQASGIVTGILLAVISFKAVSFVSYEYCHGSSHNARGVYCETVYRNEPGYRALPSKW